MLSESKILILIREFNYDIYFVTLNDLDHVTLKSCFLLSRVTPGTPPISDFYPSKYFPIICLSRQKIKKVRFPLFFFIWLRYMSVFCVYSKVVGKLVNTSGSVDARRTIFGMNTNELESKTTYLQTLKNLD